MNNMIKCFLGCFPILMIILISNYVSGQTFWDSMAIQGKTLFEIQDFAQTYFSHSGRETTGIIKEWKRWEYDANRRLDEYGIVTSQDGVYQEWLNYYKRFVLETRNSHGHGDWQPLGPAYIDGWASFRHGVGRVTSFAIDREREVILVGSETGGVWKTEDGGITWNSLTDFLPYLKVSALAIDPMNSNTFYWGSHLGRFFKSENGGSTWEQYEYGGRGNIEKILINPHNTDQIWICDLADGLYFTENGGLDWVQVIDDDIYDVDFHPTDTNVIYASGKKIWRSDDDGLSFQELIFEFENDQIKYLSVSPAAPDNLYILQNNVSRGMDGLYISRSRGEHFDRLYSGNRNLLGFDIEGRDARGQSPRTMDIIVSPTDSNIIFVGGINLWRSMDAGQTFNIAAFYLYSNGFPDIAYCHADIELIEFIDNELFVASDGGMYRMSEPESVQLNKESIEDMTPGLNIQQVYRLGFLEGAEHIVSVGAQDNGSTVLLNEDWRYFGGGDGTETFLLETEGQLLIFGSSQNGSLKISRDSGQSSQPIVGLSHIAGTGKWVTPFGKDPLLDSTIYAGYDRLYRSDNLGETFYPISQNFHPSHFDIARTGNDTIYVGTGKNIYRTTDGGETEWDRVLFQNFNRGIVNGVSVHPRNAKLIAAAVSGSQNVLLSRDGGESWEVWDENLPTFQALTLEWSDDEEETLFLGMDVGVYFRNKNMDGWELINFGLPNVKINELEMDYQNDRLYAATYGRGLWFTPVNNGISGSVTQNLDPTEFTVSPNPVLVGEDVFVKCSHEIRASLDIFDMNGRLIYQQLNKKFQHKEERFRAPVQAGLYTVVIRNADRVQSINLVVEE